MTSAAGAQSSPQPDAGRTKRIALSLAVAFVLIAGAWFVGGRQDFSGIGDGGRNVVLLPRVGEVAPDVQAYRLNENFELEVVSLSDYVGQPVWLNFWGSWCQPCRAEMPDLIEAYKQLEGTGIVMLAISLDEPIENAYLYAAQNQAPFVILSDETRQLVSQTYPINNFPTHIFIDSGGIVRSVQLVGLSVEDAIASANKAIHPEEG